MRIKAFKQTAFITKNNENMATIEIEGWDFCNSYHICVMLNNQTVVNKSIFGVKSKVFLPLVEKPVECTVILEPFCDLPQKYTYELKPVKKWTISLLASSHEDLGYCAYVNKLGYECAEYLDDAMNVIEKNNDFKYLVEHYWWLKGFEDYRGDKDYKRLRAHMESGNIELNAPHCGVHTHWSGYEQIIRSMYYSCKNAKKEWGIVPKTALFADISGVSWSVISAYANMGIKYLAILDNSFRNSRNSDKLPRLFWWLAPNKKDKLLCWYQEGYRDWDLSVIWCDTLRQYPEGEFNFDESKALRTADKINDIINQLGDVAYDLLPISFFDDRERPTSMLCIVCEEMNKRWAYPKFEVGLPGQFMNYIEDNFGETLPIYSGDWTDQWADFATISPRWFGIKREAQKMFFIAESMSALSTIHENKQYPSAKLNEAMWRMCEFDDHCWATSSKHPQKMHLFNLNLVKRESAIVAKRNLDEIIANTLNVNDVENEITIWNVIPRKRKGSLKLVKGKAISNVMCQEMKDGSIITEPLEFPAYGYKTYNLCNNTKKSIVLTDCNTIDTPFYLVKCDCQSHSILSIVDKQTNMELLDTDSDFSLGDFIYVNTDTKMDNNLHYETAKRREFEIEQGDVATVITKTGYEEQLGANVTCKITFYNFEKNIDVLLKFENATGLMGDFYDRYKKSIFYAFPFKIENYKFYTELAGGVVDETTDRLLVSPHDFVLAEDWVAVENNNRGIAVQSAQMPVFHLGGIHYNNFSSENQAKNSHIYLYAASNRSNQLNYVSKEECMGEYNISILPYLGKWQDNVPNWSEDKTYKPMIGGSMGKKEHSYMSVDASNVRMLAFKPAEDENGAIIARFIETSGKNTKAKLKLPFDVIKAECVNVIEESTDKPIETGNNEITFEIDKFSYATIKIKIDKRFEFEEEKFSNEIIRNVFSFVVENDKTILCFEKIKYDNIKAFEIFGDNDKITTIENEPYKVQYCEINSIKYKNYAVKPIL